MLYFFYLVQVAQFVGLDGGTLGTSHGRQTVPNIVAKLVDGIASLLKKTRNTFLLNNVGAQKTFQQLFQVLSANTDL